MFMRVSHPCTKATRTAFGLALLLAAITVSSPAATSVPVAARAAANAAASLPLTPASEMDGAACNDPVSSDLMAALAAATAASPAAAAAAAPEGDTNGVMCALPYDRGRPGGDCTGTHQIVISTTGTTSGAEITAELVGLDASGNLIKALAVETGDTAHLASRLDPADWKIETKNNAHSVFAPIPLLHVTVEDQGQKVEAFCSNIPYVAVQQPKGTVVTEDAGNDTNVLVAIPRTDPDSVELKVDNVDLFAALGIALPSSCTVDDPCDGVANINGNPVQVSNLIVDGTTAIGSLSSNTIRVTLSDLSCGTHLFVAEGDAAIGAVAAPSSDVCHIDDLSDTGSSSVFAVRIESPLENSVVAAGSVLVTGEVCGGRPIVNAKLNAKDLPLGGQTLTAGDGVTTGDLYTLPISETLAETDLVSIVQTGQAPPVGTVDPGTNRLAASATDDLGNRAYARRIFAAGSVAPIGIDPSALSATFSQQTFLNTVNSQLKVMLEPSVSTAMHDTTTAIEDAIVVGISPGGTQKLFDQLCTTPIVSDDPAVNGKTPGQIFSEKVTAAIFAASPKVFDVPDDKDVVPCASDPDTIDLNVTNVDVGTTLTCGVSFHEGYFHVTVGLPDIHVDVHAIGTGGDWGDDICVEGVKIEGTAFADVSNIKLEFDVTEANLLNDTTSTPVFDTGATIANKGTIAADFCGLSEICDFALDVIEFFSFGLIDIELQIDFEKVVDFSAQIGVSEPDPVKLKEMKIDETVLPSFDQKLTGNLSSVEITAQGISAGLTGHFATLAIDPEIPDTPGSLLTPAPAPTMPVPNAQDVFVGVADDTINMMFASMAAAGKLNLGCVDTTKTIGDLLPDCDTLTLDTPAATAAARGMCYGVSGLSCESLSYGTALQTATAQGICHGVQGDTCSGIPTTFGTALVEIGACNITPDFNLHADQNLLFCTQAVVPPRMMFPGDNTLTSSVDAELRVKDLSVALVVDRDGAPGFPPLGGVLADAQSCFKQDGNTAADCNLLAACLDINLDFNVGFQTCSDGKPGFKSGFEALHILNQQIGMVCGGNAPTADDDVIDETSTDQTVTIQLGQNAQQFSPDICGAGLDLGGFLQCQSPSLLAIETGGSTALKDYLAITCNVQ